MLNLLIISNNLDDSKNLLNYISQNSTLIRVYSIVNTIPDLTQIINTGIIDLILIDIDQLKNNFILDINHILQPYYKIYEKSIIILFNNSEFQGMLNNHYIYSYVKKDKDYKLLLENLEEIANSLSLISIKQNTSTLLPLIKNELEYIGYNLSYIGTKYLAECIYLAYTNINSLNCLSKKVYPIIAKKYNKPIDNIKCNISIATNAMFYDCSEKRLISYFNLCTISKPKPKQVIYTIINKLNNNH